MSRYAVLLCVLVCLADAVQKANLHNPFGFLKSSPQNTNQVAIKAEESSAKATRTAEHHVTGNHNHGEQQ